MSHITPFENQTTVNDADSDLDCIEFCDARVVDNVSSDVDSDDMSNDLFINVSDDLPIAEWPRHNSTFQSFDDDDDVPLANWVQSRPTFERTQPVSSGCSKRDSPINTKNIKHPFPTTLPDFEPLYLDSFRCLQQGRPNYFTFRNKTGHTPLGIFRWFLPNNIVRDIVSNTNSYAQCKGAGNCGRHWHDVTADEILVFIGLCVYMGVYRCPRLEDYWDRSGRSPHHLIMTHMSLKRFQQIKRFLHICDPNGDNGASFFFNKLEPWFSHVFDVLRKLWFPSTFVSVDEMMVMNYGRSSETVRMRNKPIGSGFKIWALCDSGYTFYAIPHSNRYPWRNCGHYKGILSHASAVVASLIEVLPRKVPFSRSDVDQMYAIFMDNFFTTPKLFSLLRDKDIAACGTVRSNAAGFPRSLAVRGKGDKKMDWNTLGAQVCGDDNVLALTWIDNGAVQMLTTMHMLGSEHCVERLRKRPRLTSTNGPRVRAVFGSNTTKRLPIPKVVDDYNFNMGGVDVADQLRAVYTSHMPSQRTWIPLFFWLIDTAASNGYILLKHLSKKWENRHKEFVVELAWQLVQRQGVIDEWDTLLRSDGGVPDNDVLRWNVAKHVNRKAASAGGYVTKKQASCVVPLVGSGPHLPVRVAHKERRDCFNCRVQQAKAPEGRRKRTKTAFKCASCGLFLCVEDGRNCFFDLHQSVKHNK